MAKWGLFDTQDQLWLGENATNDGPKVFDEDDVVNGHRLGEGARTVARIAAEIAARRAHWPFTRIEVRVVPEASWHVRDEVPLTDTTLNMLRKIEDGLV